MNERMEDLMYEAGLTAQGCWDELDDYDKKAIEKFAELIVEKCAQSAEEYWNDAGLQRAFSPSEYIYTILGVEE